MEEAVGTPSTKQSVALLVESCNIQPSATNKTTTKRSQRNEPNRKMEQKWKPPPTGTWKINTDGAFSEAEHTGGWGFAIRNDHGVLLAAGAGNLESVSNPLHAEASAMQQATNIAIQMGCHQVMFETDSMQLKQAITTIEYDLSELGSLFQDVKFQMRVGLNVVNVEYCSRECNKVAHTLAAHGACMGNGCLETWLGQFPEFVTKVVAGEMPSVLS